MALQQRDTELVAVAEIWHQHAAGITIGRAAGSIEAAEPNPAAVS